MNKSTWESTVKPVVVLSVIALVVSFLLALVNSFTAPIKIGRASCRERV